MLDRQEILRCRVPFGRVMTRNRMTWHSTRSSSHLNAPRCIFQKNLWYDAWVVPHSKIRSCQADAPAALYLRAARLHEKYS